ncbi:calcium-binding protein [Streptomyces aureus]|uniref:calcium-binding protein n=1 Tax=Streptomyces aureus TaxID=193461 RepID=UPI0033F28263
MRTRAVVGVLSGVLALAALGVPGADAVTKYTDVKNIVVNGGKPVALGVSGSVSVPVSMAVSVATHGAGATLYHGAWPEATDAYVNPAKECAGRTGDYTCTMNFTFTALKTVKKNADAGTWGVYASAVGNANAEKVLPFAFNVVRAAKLTTDASPEPAKYGGTITVTGRLTRANWETGQYQGNINQQVQLQFRDSNAGAYTTVKTVTSGTDGALKATVPALASGSWRWVFAGTNTTGAATSAADDVVVK